MKRFVVFRWLDHKARGGWNDACAWEETWQAAKREADKHVLWHFIEVIDIVTGKCLFYKAKKILTVYRLGGWSDEDYQTEANDGT